MKLAIRPARIIKGNVPMLKFLSVKRSSDSRRTFLRKSVALVPIASIAGCDLASTTPSATVAGTDTPTTQASTSPYTPVFFDAKEWAFVSAAVAGRRYFEKAIDQNGEPETITVDKSGANLAALEALNAERSTPIKVRQNKYLNNIVEQDHRVIKRIIKPMMGFKVRCARIILAGIELMHMIRKGQMHDDGFAKTAASNSIRWLYKQY
jgi:hypothetical protein